MSMMEDAMMELQQKQLKVLTTTLNNLRITEVLTDVILVCDQQKFPSNRNILAASSPFFAEMFQTRTSHVVKEECIKIPGIAADIMKILLKFMYTGAIIIDETDITNLMAICSAACELQLNLLVEHCCNLILALSPTSDIVLEFRKMVNNLNDSEFKNHLTSLISQNSPICLESCEFLSLPFEDAKEILSNRPSEESSSDSVLLAIVNWVAHDIDNRKMHVSSLLSCVDKNRLSDELLLEMQQPEKMKLCPELIMFVLSIMTERYQRQKGLSSSSSSLSSVVSSATENTDVHQKGTFDYCCGGSKRLLVNHLQATKSLEKSGTSRVEKDDIQKVKGKTTVNIQQTNEKDPVSVLSRTKNVLESLRMERQNGDVCDSSPDSKEQSRLTPKLSSASSSKKTILPTPSIFPNGLNSESQALKCNPAKPQHTVTENTLSKNLQLRSGLTTASTKAINEKSSNTDNKNDENYNPSVSRIDKRKQADDDLFSRLDMVIRKHDDNRNNEFRRNTPRTHSFERSHNGERFGTLHNGVKNAPRQNFRNNHILERICNSEESGNYPKNVKRGPRQDTEDTFSIERTHSSETLCSRETDNRQNRSNSSKHQFNLYRNRSLSINRRSEHYVSPKQNSAKQIATLKEADQQKSQTSLFPKDDPNKSCRSRIPIKVPVTSCNQQENPEILFFVLENDNQGLMLQSFELETNNLTMPQPIKVEIFRRCAVVSSGPAVYFIGGAINVWEVMKTVLMYDSCTGEWKQLADLEAARWGAGAAKLQHYMYVVGGVGEDNIRLNQVERYNPATNAWMEVASMKTCKEDPSVSVIRNMLCVIGGYVVPKQSEMLTFKPKPTAAGELYDPETDQWTEIETPFTVGREIDEKTFYASVSQDKIFAIRKHTRSPNSDPVNPVLYELDFQSSSCFENKLANPDFMDIVYMCSIAEDQICLVTKQGDIYKAVFIPPNGEDIQLEKCLQGRLKGLMYAVSASK